MPSNPSALQTAVQLATRERDAAARRLAQARQGWTAAQMQLDQLDSYAQETLSRWRTQSTRCTPEIMVHHHQFMERLTHAMQLQTGAVAQHAATVKLMADKLRAAETRRESLLQLHTQRENEVRRAFDRREQKATDERAAMQFQRRLAGGMAGGM